MATMSALLLVSLLSSSSAFQNAVPAIKSAPRVSKVGTGIMRFAARPAAVSMVSTATAGVDAATVPQAGADKPVQMKPTVPGDPFIIGLSHNTATVDVRERLSINEADWDEASKLIRSLDGVDEAGVLSTCNRFEVYIVTKDEELAKESILTYLEGHSGLDRRALMDNLFFDFGDEAVRHVLKVSAGFDSLVVGEGQILSQVKACHTHGISEDGSFGKVLTKFFNTAVCSGKRVRSETDICKGAVSISSAAVELAILRAEKVLGKDLKCARVCIVGAGKMSRLAVTHLLSHDVPNIHIVNRGLERMQQLADGFPDANLQLHLQSESLWEEMMAADVIITSTGSTGCLVTQENLAENWGTRAKPMMLVDISVPRNVERETNSLEGVTAYNVDDLKEVVAINQAKRKGEMAEAEKLLDEEFFTFKAWKESLRCIPAIMAIQKRGEEIRQEELRKFGSKIEDMDKKERQMIEKLTKGIVNKLMHGPMSELRSQDGKVDVTAKLSVVDAMFQLGLDEARLIYKELSQE